MNEKKKKRKRTSRAVLILDENSDGEADYSLEEQVMLHMTLAESNFTMGEWKECIDSYQFVVTNEADEERRGYAILQLINSFIALEQYDDAKDSISDLYETDARYNIRVNMALMSTAAALFNAEEYDSAPIVSHGITAR